MSGARGGWVPEHAIHMAWRAALRVLIIACCITLPMGIWRSVYRDVRHRKPEIIAKLEASVGALAALLIFAFVGELTLIMSWRYDGDISDAYDPLRTSMNASVRLKRNNAFPLTGFWQTSCGNGVGVAIERESPFLRTYRLEDCGTEGCGPHGGGSKVYGSIKEGPSFRVVEQNTIQLETTLYHRCG
jgi:hypothetical protein